MSSAVLDQLERERLQREEQKGIARAERDRAAIADLRREIEGAQATLIRAACTFNRLRLETDATSMLEQAERLTLRAALAKELLDKIGSST